jgi:hypothetical protein
MILRYWPHGKAIFVVKQKHTRIVQKVPEIMVEVRPCRVVCWLSACTVFVQNLFLDCFRTI